MDNERKVQRGEKLKIKASTFNGMVDILKRDKLSHLRGGVGTPTDTLYPNTTVLVQNAVGSISDSYAVMKLEEPYLENIQLDIENSMRRPVFIGVTPDRDDNPIAIVQTPPDFGEISRGVVAGITLALVHFEDGDYSHTWAKPKEGFTDRLVSCESDGVARIIYYTDPPLGYSSDLRLAVVNLTGGASGGGKVPPCCPVWYTAYHHLGTMAVSVGQQLEAGALIGTVGTPTSGSHSHFSLGDGSDFLNLTNYAVVGQTLDITDWLPWPTEGTRAVTDPPLYDPPVFAGTLDQQAAREYIRSVFAPWLPTAGYKQVYGSTEHKGGDYYAVDVFPEDVTPGPPTTAMAGTPITLAIRSNQISSVVIFADEINPDVQSMVIVRHTPCCGTDVFKTKYVKCATVESGDIDTDYVVGSTVDDVVLALGDPILIKNQGAGAQNRIGTVNTMGAPTFRADADTGEKLVGAVVRVMQGTVNSNTIWTCLNSAVSFGSTATVWQVVWQTGFFARLVSESSGMWKWQKLTSTAGTWSDDGPESPTYSASPIKFDGTNFFSTPVAGMRVWMHWGKTEWEFFPIGLIPLDCGLAYDAVTNTYYVDPGDFAGTGLTAVYPEIGCPYLDVDGDAIVPILPLGCGLLNDAGVLVVDFSSVVSNGLTWDEDLCLLGIELECGLYYTGTGIAVNTDDIAGVREVTALVPVAGIDPACDSVGVDLEVHAPATTTETVVTNVVMSVVAGKLRTTLTKVTYTNYFNIAGLHIDRTAGSPVDTYADLDICPIVECCLAEPLVAECTKSNSGGELVDNEWGVDFTAGATGGISTLGDCTDYTYSWDFGDESLPDTTQNPTHVYTTAGVFTPVVTVTDCCGKTDTCSPGDITVTSCCEITTETLIDSSTHTTCATAFTPTLDVGYYYTTGATGTYTWFLLSAATDAINHVVLSDPCGGGGINECTWYNGADCDNLVLYAGPDAACGCVDIVDGFDPVWLRVKNNNEGVCIKFRYASGSCADSPSVGCSDVDTPTLSLATTYPYSIDYAQYGVDGAWIKFAITSGVTYKVTISSSNIYMYHVYLYEGANCAGASSVGSIDFADGCASFTASLTGFMYVNLAANISGIQTYDLIAETGAC